MNNSRKIASAPQHRRHGVAVWEWRVLARRLDDLLGLDVYGQETDERWDGQLRALREALLWVDEDPDTVHIWLRDGGEQLLRNLANGSPPLSYDTFRPYVADPFVRRLRKLLIKRGALPRSDQWYETHEQEILADLFDPNPRQRRDRSINGEVAR